MYMTLKVPRYDISYLNIKTQNYETTLQNSVKNVSWYFVKTQTTFFILEAQQATLEMSHHNLTYVRTKYQNKTRN